MKANSDVGVSAALLSLIADAKRKPRRFDAIIIDDISRFGRRFIDDAWLESLSLDPEREPNMEGNKEEE